MTISGTLKDDVLAGWVIGGICAVCAVRWVVFPEAFWRGNTGGEGRFEIGSQQNMLPLQHDGALAMMMGSAHGSRDGSSSDVGADMLGGAIISGDVP